MGYRVVEIRYRGLGIEFRVLGFKDRVWYLRFRVQGLVLLGLALQHTVTYHILLQKKRIIVVIMRVWGP